jgi:hypothetical protein
MRQALENSSMNASRKVARILAIAALACMAGALSPAFAQGHSGGGGGHSGSSGGGGHSGSSGGGGHSSSSSGGGGHGGYSSGGSHAHYAVGSNGGMHSGSGYHGSYYRGSGYYGRGYYGGGYWHGGYWNGSFWRGGCCFGPRFGFGWFLPILPAFYATYWWGGIPYYYANDAYYTWSPNYNGYVATDPPAGPADNDGQPPAAGSQAPANGAPANGQTFEYPKNGQTAEQQASDRYQCHQWAVSQSGYDPTGNGTATTGQDNYHRALTACMEGRGYSVR